MNPVYQRLIGSSAEIWAMDDVRHIKGLQTHPEEYERRVVGFFDDALLDDATARGRVSDMAAPFASYRRVLTLPGAWVFSVGGLLARMPMAMVSLGIVLLVSSRTGSYGTGRRGVRGVPRRERRRSRCSRRGSSTGSVRAGCCRWRRASSPSGWSG